MGHLCGCCRWCLLLLAGWCEGFYGVRVSEALAAYVVLMPSRLFGCISLGFIARGNGSADSPARL